MYSLTSDSLLDDKTIEAWRVLSLGFNSWLYSQLVSGDVTVADVEHRYPALWRRYILETKQSDVVPVDYASTEKKE